MTHAEIDDDEPVAPPSGFASVLREATADVHRHAERAGIIADLLRNRATRTGYAAFLRNLVPAYAALESALAATSARAPASSLVAAFSAPGLARLAALTRDLEAISGPHWASRVPLVPEAEAYAAAIAAAAADEPALVAHAYARYLGDLSGGQILKPLLSRTLGLGPEALGIYDFPGLADIAATKGAMRAALDTVPAGSPEGDRLVAEAIAAFRHTIAVSDAVQRVAAG